MRVTSKQGIDHTNHTESVNHTHKPKPRHKRGCSLKIALTTVAVLAIGVLAGLSGLIQLPSREEREARLIHRCETLLSSEGVIATKALGTDKLFPSSGDAIFSLLSWKHPSLDLTKHIKSIDADVEEDHCNVGLTDEGVRVIGETSDYRSSKLEKGSRVGIDFHGPDTFKPKKEAQSRRAVNYAKVYLP